MRMVRRKSDLALYRKFHHGGTEEENGQSQRIDGYAPKRWRRLMRWCSMCRPYGAQFLFIAYPPFRLRIPTPTRENRARWGPRSLASGWANLATRLRR